MSFVNEREIKAIRKPRRCDGCSVKIEAGESAIGWAGTVDGDFITATYHPDCRKAEIALNSLHGNGWADDWMSLCTDLEWEDHPWLLEEYPAVAARMGITAETISANEKERADCDAAFAALKATQS